MSNATECLSVHPHSKQPLTVVQTQGQDPLVSRFKEKQPLWPRATERVLPWGGVPSPEKENYTHLGIKTEKSNAQ